MAGSYNHIINKDGDLITNQEFIEMIENLGDAYEMAEECWYIIQLLASGDQKKIDNAITTTRHILNHKHR